MTTKESKPKSESQQPEYTPGPWRMSSGMVETVTGIPIAWMDREPGNGTLPVERDANARLICAAPDLLETAKKVSAIIAEWAETCGDELGWAKGDEKDQAINAFVAAISKAEGRK